MRSNHAPLEHNGLGMKMELTMTGIYGRGVLEDTSVDIMESVETTDLKDLVVFNDDVNTFEHVIQTLIRVCKHTTEQAEQCTWIIHYKGKCCVKKDELKVLRPMRRAICDAGIDARII